jgi:hypothetical protein
MEANARGQLAAQERPSLAALSNQRLQRAGASGSPIGVAGELT